MTASIRIGALAVLAVLLAACGSDPVSPGAAADAGGIATDAGSGDLADAEGTDAAPAWEPRDPQRWFFLPHEEGASIYQAEDYVAGETFVPWAERSLRLADAWSVCLAGGEVVRDIDTRLDHDRDLSWENAVFTYPPCVAHFDWALDTALRDDFPACATDVLTDAAIEACTTTDDCRTCLADLGAAQTRACDAARTVTVLRSLEYSCRPDRYDYRELWGL